MTISAAPNPVMAGDLVTVTVVVTNSGPSVASGTTVTNYLPAGLVLTASSAPMGTVASSGGTNGGTNTWNVGDLPANASATLTLTAMATAATGETVLDSVVVASLVYRSVEVEQLRLVQDCHQSGAHAFHRSGRARHKHHHHLARAGHQLCAARRDQPHSAHRLGDGDQSRATAIVSGQDSVTLPTSDRVHFFILTTP